MFFLFRQLKFQIIWTKEMKLLKYVRSFAIFCYFVVRISLDRSSSSRSRNPSVLGSIMVVGALTCYSLLHSVSDQKASEVNEHTSLIRDLMICELSLRLNNAEAAKNICCAQFIIVASNSTRVARTSTIKWFQVKQFIVCTQLNVFKLGKWLHSSIKSIDRILMSTPTLGLSEPGSIGNKEVVLIFEALGHSLGGGLIPLQRFSRPNLRSKPIVLL